MELLKGVDGKVESDEKAQRWRTEWPFVVPGVTGAAVLFWLAGHFKWASPQPFWFVLIVFFFTASVAYAVDRWYEGCKKWQFHTRVALKTATVAFCIYITGWGPTLIIGLFYVLADTLENFGAGAMPATLVWAAIAIAVGQEAIELHIAPSIIHPPTVNGLALLSFAGLIAAAFYLRIAVLRREEAQVALSEGQLRFQALVQHSSDLIMLLDADGTINYASPSAIAFITGSPPATPNSLSDENGPLAQLPDKSNLLQLIHEDDLAIAKAVLSRTAEKAGKSTAYELRLLNGDGSWRDLELTTSNLLDMPGVAGMVINARDITQRKIFEAELAVRATTDPLTGLSNRTVFRERLDHVMTGLERRATNLAVLFIDVDHFKEVNDTMGHDAGDELLIAIVKRMRSCLRVGDTLARLGGDEFTILIEEAGENVQEANARAALVAERIIAFCSQPFLLSEGEASVSVSIGIAACGFGLTSDIALRNADLAMYRAKENGRSRYEIYPDNFEVDLQDQTNH